MIRRPIRSTSLKAVGYDPVARSLEIEYRHGGLVRYTGVPTELYQALLRVPGKALFVEQLVERGGFGREQLRGKPDGSSGPGAGAKPPLQSFPSGQ